MREYFANDVERAEYETLLRNAWGGADGQAIATAKAAEEMHRLLVEAERAGKRWAAVILDAATASGLQSMGKRWLKSQSPVVVSHDGKMLGSTSARVGVVRRTVSTGTPVVEQRLFEFLTWEDVLAKQRLTAAQIRQLGVSRAAITKLLKLRKRFPESSGPGEACKMAGTTIEEYLVA